MLLLSLLKVLIIVVLFMTLTHLKQLVCKNILCLMIIGIHKMYNNKINIKNQVCNCYFILIYGKNHKDFVILIVLDMFTMS